MGLRVNLGAGSDVREGWLNLDNAPEFGGDVYDPDLPSWQYKGVHGAWRADMRYLDDVERDDAYIVSECAEWVLLNHSLHYVTPDDADLVLDQAVRILEPGGRLVIVEPDILGVIEDYYGDETPHVRERFVRGLISDDLEPTDEGKILRWASWFGERRSLWSWPMLYDRLTRRGLFVEYAGPSTGYEVWGEARRLESFTVIGVK